jgi:TonB family protein
MASIQQNLVYPELARKAGIEGSVLVLTIIDENGNVIETKVNKSLGDNGCDEAAMEAIRKTKWKPAVKEGKNVKTRIGVPVVFRLAKEDTALSKEKLEIFTGFDKRPEPIGGMAAIQKNLIYPEVARKAGVEGTVLVQSVIDVNGDVIETRIIKSLGDSGCDEAAANAIKAIKWKPAYKEDKPVNVQIAIPVIFRLSNKESKAPYPELEIYKAFDKNPEPVGGIEAIHVNLEYPQSALDAGVEGTVVIKAVIEATGKVSEIKIIESLGEPCDKAAINAILSVKWHPALKENKPVKAEVTIPVVFKLTTETDSES